MYGRGKALSSRHNRPIDVDLFKACYSWSSLDLHVEEIHVLPVQSVFIVFDPHATQKASVGMYSGYDYLLYKI